MVPFDHAHVAVAQPGGVDAHPHLVGPQVAHLDVVANLQLPVQTIAFIESSRQPFHMIDCISQ